MARETWGWSVKRRKRLDDRFGVVGKFDRRIFGRAGMSQPARRHRHDMAAAGQRETDDE